MDTDAVDYRRYLDPATLARITSLDLRARLIVEGLVSGMHRSPYQGISVEFAQHRQYVAGDDIRHVDWKVYGKTDKVYLKQYLQETNLQLICVVDASQSMGFGTVGRGGIASVQETSVGPGWSKYDHATAVATALSYLAISQQDAAGVAIFDDQLRRYCRPGNSPGHWKAVVHELQMQPRRSKTDMGRILEQLGQTVSHRSLIVILSDFFDDLTSIARGLSFLSYKKHEIIALQVLDPAEIEFPFEDVQMFQGLEETGELLIDPRSVRAGYLQELTRATEQLKRTCRGLGIDCERVNTSQGLDIPLRNLLTRRASGVK
ncbi:MAG: DUF58 domain-containing protein [Phycisphaerales bacterium]|nr:DUF58 domain-containing protein [Phycisphaerales bacterium]